MIVPTGQRIAHRPHRMQRVSSFNMADPVTIPSSIGCNFVQFHPKAFLVVANVLHGFVGELNPVERNQFQTFFGTDIDAATTKNAERAIFLGTFKNRVDPAVQAALRFLHCGWASYPTSTSVTPVRLSSGSMGTGWRSMSRKSSGMACRRSTSTSISGPGCFSTRRYSSMPNRRTLSVANAIDNETRSEDAIAAREDAGSRGHQRLRIHCNQTAR